MKGMTNKLFAVLLMAAFVGLLIAASAAPDPSAQIKNAVNTLCGIAVTVLPTVALLMIIAAAVLYAAGQFMGAETRARASVWATAMLTGAIIGILIAVIAPWILGTLLGTSLVSSACVTSSGVAPT